MKRFLQTTAIGLVVFLVVGCSAPAESSTKSPIYPKNASAAYIIEDPHRDYQARVKEFRLQEDPDYLCVLVIVEWQARSQVSCVHSPETSYPNH